MVPSASEEQRNFFVPCRHQGEDVYDKPGAPQYKRMDKLVKEDKLWTRRYRRNRREQSQGQISIVECVMTFACPPEGQPMVDLILIAFITGNSSLEPLIEGLCAQIHVNLR